MNAALLVIVLLMVLMSCCVASSSVALAAYMRFFYVPVQKPRKKNRTTTTTTTTTTTAAPAGSLTAAPMPYEVPEGMKTDCPPGKRGVIGYKDMTRSGLSYMWCRHDTGRGAGIEYIGNDKLSHLSVPRGMKVTAYQNNDMGGHFKIFSEGEWDLHDVKNNFDNGTATQVPNASSQIRDKISSLKIEGTPPNARTDTTVSSYMDHNRSGI